MRNTTSDPNTRSGGVDLAESTWGQPVTLRLDLKMNPAWFFFLTRRPFIPQQRRLQRRAASKPSSQKRGAAHTKTRGSSVRLRPSSSFSSFLFFSAALCIQLFWFFLFPSIFKRLVGHVGRCACSLFCRELAQKINTTRWNCVADVKMQPAAG